MRSPRLPAAQLVDANTGGAPAVIDAAATVSETMSATSGAAENVRTQGERTSHRAT